MAIAWIAGGARVVCDVIGVSHDRVKRFVINRFRPMATKLKTHNNHPGLMYNSS